MSEENNNTAANIAIDQIVDERGVPLSNVLKELTRKLGRLGEVNTKVDMLLQNNVQNASASPDKGSYDVTGIDASTRRYIDSRLQEDKKAVVEKAQKAALDTVFTTFPELNQSSDDFDRTFFDLAVEHERSIDISDPQRPMKAAKLAALELGKMEKLAKSQVIQDESRRTRKLSEGSAPTKESKGKTGSTMNKSLVQRFLKVDPAKVEKYVNEEGES